jgi:hypothetical protein
MRRGGSARRLALIVAAALLAALLQPCAAANFAAPCDPASVQPAPPGGCFDRCAVLRERAGGLPALRLLWRVRDGNITLGVHVDTPLEQLGYVGVGASWNGGMKGAELWVAQMVEGEFSLGALWSEDYVRPSTDAQVAVTLLGWTSVAGEGAAWAFTRRTAVGDAPAMRSMPLAQPLGDIIIWAMGTEPGEFGYHGAEQRGSKRVMLAGPTAVEGHAEPSDAKVVAIVAPPTTTDGAVSRCVSACMCNARRLTRCR